MRQTADEIVCAAGNSRPDGRQAQDAPGQQTLKFLRLAIARCSMKKTLHHLYQSRRSFLVLRFLCALIWAMELWWGQGLGFEVLPVTKHPWLFPGIRFGLDLILTAGFCLILKRRIMVPLMWGNLLVFSLLATYTHHFHRPLMPINAWTQWREAWGACGNIFDILSWKIIVVALLSFLLKFLLIVKSGRLDLTLRAKLEGWAVMILLYAIPVTVLQFSSFKLNLDCRDMPRYVFAYGYTLPWIGDVFVNANASNHRQRALACFSEHYDRITPLEKPLAIKGHIVVLQLETVGTAAADAKYGENLVMPFFHSLKDTSMVYRIRAFHWNGSCDMDYAGTTFVRPYEFLNPYRIPDLPYTNTMPIFMKKYGYKTAFFHGNFGAFYNRENVIEKLGFDEVYFKRQLMLQAPETSEIGVRDRDMFQFVLAAMLAAPRTYTHLVTLDTHAPFAFIRPEEQEIFSDPKNDVERYFNCLRYLDGCLKNFINDIPEGTTVILYGDHTASLNTGGFKSDVVGNKEFVNGIIYQKGRDLSQIQKTRRDLIAMNGELNLLDVLAYVRNSVAASNEK
jgi:hypothetical protein